MIAFFAIISSLYSQDFSNHDKSIVIEIKQKINKITNGLEKNYGFANRAQVDSINIMPIIQIYRLNLKDSSIYKIPNFLYPIELNGKIIFFTKGMKMEDGSLKILGIGGNIFAQKIQAAISSCSLENNFSLIEISEANTFLYFDEREKDSVQDLRFYSLAQFDDCSQCFIAKQQCIDLVDLITRQNQYHLKNTRDENFTN